MAPLGDERGVDLVVLRDVIEEALNHRAVLLERGHKVESSLTDYLAAVIYAVMTSAWSEGCYGPGMLVHAPMLDMILAGAEYDEWRDAVLTMLAEHSAADLSI